MVKVEVDDGLNVHGHVRPRQAQRRRSRSRLRSTSTGRWRTLRLYIEQEVHDVAVLDDVVLALDAQLAGGLDRSLLAVLIEVVDGVDLGADEALLEVGVDHAGRLGSERALADRPRADLLLAGGEVRLQAEQAVAFAGERRERGLSEAVRREQLAA